MNLKTLPANTSLKGKTVIVRASLNVPLEKGKVDKDGTWRLTHVISALKEIRKRKGKYIVIGHLGRPGGSNNKYSLKPVASYLKKNTPGKLTFVPALFGTSVDKKIAALKSGDGLILENVRFHKEEEKNNLTFARKIASYGDIYIDEAFGNAHRKHASMVAITKFLPSYAGKRFTEEVRVLSGIMKKPKKPLVLLIGGAKVVTKLDVINQFMGKADAVLLGGLVVNTILYREFGVNKSFSKKENDAIDRLFKLYKKHKEIKLPIDVIRKREGSAEIINPSAINAKDAIIDIGPKTAKMYHKCIADAATIIWNGPMGLIEDEDGMKANAIIARSISKARGKKYIGGGETVEAVHELGLMKKMTFISTGGGAMLEFLAGNILPALEVLRRK
jgi:3-phosphoglycerate kinase